jgi:hypothetical protein
VREHGFEPGAIRRRRDEIRRVRERSAAQGREVAEAAADRVQQAHLVGVGDEVAPGLGHREAGARQRDRRCRRRRPALGPGPGQEAVHEGRELRALGLAQRILDVAPADGVEGLAQADGLPGWKPRGALGRISQRGDTDRGTMLR